MTTIHSVTQNIKETALQEEYWVEKSNNLILSTFIGYSATALKLLDVYLSKINARDKSTKVVRFTKQEFCRLVGMHEKSKTSEISNALDCLQKSQVTFPDRYQGMDGIKKSILFPNAGIYLDKKTGKQVITLECNAVLEDLFFDVRNQGYTKYLLKNMLGLKSSQGMLLYNRLKLESFGKTEWGADLAELKSTMGMTSDQDKDMRHFRRTLDRCCGEINQETDIDVSYELIREGTNKRKIGGFRFHIGSKGHKENIPAETEKKSWREDSYDFWGEAMNNEFSKDQVKAIVTWMLKDFQKEYPDSTKRELAIYDYLHSLYTEVCANKEVKNRYAYIKSVVKKQYAQS